MQTQSMFDSNCTGKRGHPGKQMRLYHVTSDAAARKIAKNLRMHRGQTGMYGGGIYFAESLPQASNKAHFAGAFIIANVLVGRSAVFQHANPGISYTLLTSKGFDSVLGAHSLNFEYVVYNWDQVQILEIHSNNSIIYKSQQETSKSQLTHECSEQKYVNFGTTHTGPHQFRCSNSQCVNFNKFHNDAHKLRCALKDCYYYNQFHLSDHVKKCNSKDCEYFGKFHLGQHKYVCNNVQCENFGNYHEDGHKFKCTLGNCAFFGTFHEEDHDFISPKPSSGICNNSQCSLYGKHHEGQHKYVCSRSECINFGEFHPGDHKYKCNKEDCINFTLTLININAIIKIANTL